MTDLCLAACGGYHRRRIVQARPVIDSPYYTRNSLFFKYLQNLDRDIIRHLTLSLIVCGTGDSDAGQVVRPRAFRVGGNRPDGLGREPSYLSQPSRQLVHGRLGMVAGRRPDTPTDRGWKRRSLSFHLSGKLLSIVQHVHGGRSRLPEAGRLGERPQKNRRRNVVRIGVHERHQPPLVELGYDIDLHTNQRRAGPPR